MIKYVILGVIQGLTEFFPVSSSAHLVIMQKILGIESGQLANTIVLHLGTLLSLVIFFFRDILEILKDLRSVLLILLVTLITGIIGIAGKDFFIGLFSAVVPVSLALICTGIILLLTAKFTAGKKSNPNFKDAAVLGLAQGASIIPGISRSGITISTLLFRGMEREAAFRFSFLASLPAIFGATLLEIKDIGDVLKVEFLGLAVGFLCSLFAGLFALWVLKSILRKAKLHYFGFYCIIIAILTLIFVR